MSHEEHAGDGEKHQRVILAALQVHALEVTIGDGDGTDPTGEEKDAQERREAIQHDHPAESGKLLPGLGEGHAQRSSQSDGCQECRPALATLGDEQVDQQEDAGPGDDDDDRENCGEIGLRHNFFLCVSQ